MDIVKIQKKNNTHIKIIADPDIMMELSDKFTFDVPGAKFSPKFKARVWDGKIKLLNVMTGLLYSGLIDYVIEFCNVRNYKVELLSDFSDRIFSDQDALDFINTLDLPEKYSVRDYQLAAFVRAVRKKRLLLLSPTASGKSFIIYLLARFYNIKTLIIVPTTALVSQLASDFADYGYDASVHKIYAGKKKNADELITISTWQSLYTLPPEYFEQYQLVIGDEAHLFKAKSLISILSCLDNCNYKIGFTGTLDGSETNQLVLEGLFGKVYKVVSTNELIDQGYLSKFKIKAIVLSYPLSIRKLSPKMTYVQEMDYLVRQPNRNKFIQNLTLSLNGNTLLLFQYVEKHGKVLYENLKSNIDRPVYYVSGEIEGKDREDIRMIMEKETNAIVVASFGTFSTGTNIRNLHNLVFASPSKSKIRNLQSIGRILRLSDNQSVSTLYDISDDLSYKGYSNKTINHFMERIKIYNEEQFEYKIYNIDLSIN